MLTRTPDGRLCCWPGPTTRVRLLRGAIGAAAAGAVVLAGVAAVAILVGAAAIDAHLQFGAALAGAVNMVPIAALSAATAAVALGWFPTATTAAGSLPAAGDFLWLVIADSVGAGMGPATCPRSPTWHPCHDCP